MGKIRDAEERQTVDRGDVRAVATVQSDRRPEPGNAQGRAAGGAGGRRAGAEDHGVKVGSTGLGGVRQDRRRERRGGSAIRRRRYAVRVYPRLADKKKKSGVLILGWHGHRFGCFFN